MNNPTPQRFGKSSDICTWLNVAPSWLRNHRRDDPRFTAIDIGHKDAQNRTWRYDLGSLATSLGIPLDLDENGQPRPLMTAEQVYAWLSVGEMWLIKRMQEPDFPVINIGLPDAEKRTLRFHQPSLAAHLGIPFSYAAPQPAAA